MLCAVVSATHVSSNMDVSLDDYMVGNNVNFQVQISNPTAQTSRGRVRGRGRGMSRGTFKQRGGLQSAQTQRFQNKGQFGGQPLSVTVQNKVNFDARDTIAQKKKPLDARNKLMAKAKQSDARAKILNLKANKTGSMNKKGSDARAMIVARKHAKQNRSANNGTGVGIMRQTPDSFIQTRDLDEESQNFQIMRQVPNVNTGNQRFQMSGDNVVITRTLLGTQSTQPAVTPLFSKTISNQQTLGNVHINPQGPVIQLQNEMYQAHPRTQPLYSQVMGYESEESDPWTQAVGAYTAEKTLTVEMPQGHSHFTKTRAPKQKFQLNKITFSHEKTVPVTPISPPVAMKRKASQDTFSLTTGKQLRLGGRMKTLKPVRPVTAPQITAHVIKRTKPVKPAPTPVLPDEFQEDLSDVVLSPLQGYRIMISNLHTIVTQDDIIELFGAIGPMKRARLVKQGMAEVVYVQKDDAVKAAQKYHNRELDGQSMQVKLLTSTKAPVKQAIEVPSPVSQPVKEKGGPLRLGQNMRKNTGGESVDLSTLHRALFKSPPAKNVQPVTFTVKI